MWIFTRHALLRMKERGFLREEVLSVLEGDTSTLVYPSPREESVELYFGQARGKYMMVPVDKGKKTVITVRPMRRKEIETFNQETKNG